MNQVQKSAAGEIYTELRRLILSGDLKAGQSLKVATLHKQFGFSATPLREALNRLCAEHLVVNAFNQGFSVAPISLQELEDLGQIRLLLEADMLLASLRDAGEDWESRIVAAHYQLSKWSTPEISWDPETFDQWDTRHRNFHSALTSGCLSIWMNRMMEQVETQLARYHSNILSRARSLAKDQPELVQRINQLLADVMGLEVHTPLMEATLARNEDAAARLMRDHIRMTSEVFQSIQVLLPDTLETEPKLKESSR
ncbi:GntR family transcriptional regulator [Gelidibacter sp. F2691]|nr:GntR family transcriptional regulator [Gelidibacter sp. F2691]